MPIVQYTDEDGRTWAVACPETMRPEHYRFGARLGPPDLSELGIDAAVLNALYAKLVDHGIYDGQTIMNNRWVVREILAELGLPQQLERWITAIYAREYF